MLIKRHNTYQRGLVSYRNKTYIIFDGDKEMWAYAFMKGWKQNERIDFDFHDAHDIKPIAGIAEEAVVKSALKARFATAKQVIVLVGESTKNLYRYVRWELDVAKNLDLPIIVVNINNLRKKDDDRCPPIIRDDYAVHIPFKLKIIQHALDKFPLEYHARDKSKNLGGDRYYSDDVYEGLGL